MLKKLLFYIVLFLSFAGKTRAQDKKNTAEEYIQTYKDLAVSEMNRTGIPASITLAQGLLESGNGNSVLAKEANNHFGIKCKSSWTGKSIKVDDDELQECFRAYDKAEDSYKDHSDFLTGNSRYSFLFKLKTTDYKGWAYGLKQAGYATNPKYPEMIISVIEKYKLSDYDLPVNNQIAKKEEPVKPKEPLKNIFGHTLTEGTSIVYNNIKAYEIKPGDTYGSIADAHNMMRWELRKYNDLQRNEELKPGTIIYLKPKRRKAKEEFHDVKEGEGMYYISQYHGIKLRLLYKWNRMKKGQEPAAGEKLYLRHKRKEPPVLKTDGTIMPRQGIILLKPQKPKEEPRKDSLPKIKEPVKNIQPKKDSLLNTKSADGTDSIGRFHIVEQDETVYGISKAYNVSFGNLLTWNKVSGALKKGQKIYITQPKNTDIKSKTNPVENKTDSSQLYIVKQGETLYSISKKLRIPVDTLVKFNVLLNNSLHEGQALIIAKKNRKEDPAKKDNAPGTEPEYHTVSGGETLYSIARKYNITIQQLIDLNELKTNSISVGQKLKIKG